MDIINRTIATVDRTLGRTLVGDFETEYDEFDLDEDVDRQVRRTGWLEPSW